MDLSEYVLIEGAARDRLADLLQTWLRSIARQPGGRSVTCPNRCGGESRMSGGRGTQVYADAGRVEALRRDDPGAAEQLVERYGERVDRLAVRITGTSDDAEAAAQDALSRATRTIDTFKGELAFGSWIDRIAAGAAYQKLRTRRPKTGE